MFKFRHQSADPFYSDYNDGDLIRLPLIKPYVAEQLVKKTGWMIRLFISPNENGIPSYIDIFYPEKVSIENNVIMVYTTYKPEYLQTLGEKSFYWFVLLPEEKRETGFDNKTDFLNFIKKYGIDSPNWQDIDSAFQQFQVTGCLSWIPDCK